MTNERGTENRVVEHGKGGEGVGRVAPFQRKGRPIHSCRNSWTSFSKIMISQRHISTSAFLLRSPPDMPLLHAVCAAMAYCMRPHAVTKGLSYMTSTREEGVRKYPNFADKVGENAKMLWTSSIEAPEADEQASK